MNKISHNIMCNRSRYERVHDRDFLVLEAMAMAGDAAMNGYYYPQSVVSNKAPELKGKPAPLSHPKAGMTHTSASDFFVKGAFDVGAQVMDSYMAGQENMAEIWIDKEVAERTDRGKQLISRADSRLPIGVSTGLVPTKVRDEKGTDRFGQPYSKVIENYTFDHLALLLDEVPAGEKAGTKIIYNSEQSALILNHDDGGQPESQLEENSMKVEFDISDLGKAERVQFQNLTVNSIMEAVNKEIEPVSLDDAKEVVTNAGLVINSKEDGVFISNEDNEFLTNAKKAEVERVDEIREHIVSNSKMTDVMLKDMSETQLMGIYNSLTPVNNHEIQGAITTNAQRGDSADFEMPEGA